MQRSSSTENPAIASFKDAAARNRNEFIQRRREISASGANKRRQLDAFDEWSALYDRLLNSLISHSYTQRYTENAASILVDMTRQILTLSHIEEVLPLSLDVALKVNYTFNQGNFVPLTMLYTCLLETQPHDGLQSVRGAFEHLLTQFLSQGSPFRKALQVNAGAVQWSCCAAVKKHFPALMNNWFGAKWQQSDHLMNAFFWMRSSELWIERRNVSMTVAKTEANAAFQKVYARHRKYLRYLVEHAGAAPDRVVFEQQLENLAGAVLELLVTSSANPQKPLPRSTTAVLEYLQPQEFDAEKANKHIQLLRPEILHFEQVLARKNLQDDGSRNSNDAIAALCVEECTSSGRRVDQAARSDAAGRIIPLENVHEGARSTAERSKTRERLSLVRAAVQGAVAGMAVGGAASALSPHLRGRKLHAAKARPNPLHVAGAAALAAAGAVAMTSLHRQGRGDLNIAHS